MAINNTILISSAAKNGTLGSQAAAATDEIIFDTAITTNNGNLEAGPSFVGRTVIVRQGVAAAASTGTLTFTGIPSATNTVLINGKTYTFVTALSDPQTDTADDGEVLIGGTTQASLDNLIAAINLDLAGYGTQYNQVTTANSDVTVVDGGSTTMTTTASTAGTAGDSITTTVGGGMTVASWGAATLGSGADGEETRFMTAIAGDNVTATVHEVWDAQPASGDTYQVSYITFDVDTIGNNFKLLLKRNTDWAASQEITVGNGTDFAYFALLEGHSIETVDNSSTTVADIIVANNGRFDSGYVASNTPVSGGYTVTTPAVAGELAFDVQSGGEAILNDYFITAAKANNMTWWNGDVTFNKTKIFKNSYTMQVQGGVSATNLTIEGTSTTNDTILIDASTDVQSMVLISTFGFITDNDDVTQTITLNNVTFVGNSKLFVIEEQKTINLIDPVSFSPVVSDQSEIDFITSVTNPDGELNERYSLSTTVSQADGTVIGNARLFLYEGLRTDLIVLDLTTDPLAGTVSSSWLYKNYTDNTTTVAVLTDGDHALKVYKYGFIPFVAAQTSNAKFSDPITLGVDTAQSETTQADAITLGDTTNTVTTTESTAGSEHSTFDYSSGSGTPVKGDSFTCGSATGTIVEILEGDNASGTMILEGRNATAIPVSTAITSDGAWSATSDSPTNELRYRWLIESDGLTMQELYDYMSAKLADDTLDTAATKNFDDIIAWGTDEHGFMIQASGAKFKTVRNIANTEGIIVADLPTLTDVAFFTADDGGTFTPSTTVTLTITVKDTSGVAVEDARVRIEQTSDNSLISNGVTNASGIYTDSFTHTVDVPVNIIVRLKGFINFRTTGDITASGLDVGVRFVTDTIVNLP